MTTQLLKPCFVSHEETPIFSVDIHPDGARFATAGADQKVRIWNMAVILSAEIENDPSVPRSFATLSDHFGSVNCVRWSNDGFRLASGSDDRLVMVHEQKEGPAAVVFGNDKADLERWQLCGTCRGHTSDVVDISWSPDDRHIASCGLDCTVRIWETTNFSQVINLEGHVSLVKGVSWDPIGSFVASQSDDKTVLVWETTGWKQVAKVSGSYEKTVGATFFRRLAWSPCGSFLTTTHAFSEPRHTAAVIDREVWTKSHDFVGHSAPVVAVRYNRTLFKREGSAEPYSCLAMGGQDCRFTVWLSCFSKPVMIGKHFFKQPVVDFAWGADGYTLLCVSTDGTMTAVLFSKSDLGVALTHDEMDALKQERYGDNRGPQLDVPHSAMLASISGRVPDGKKKGFMPAGLRFGGSKRVNPIEALKKTVFPPKSNKPSEGKRRIVPEPLNGNPPEPTRKPTQQEPSRTLSKPPETARIRPEIARRQPQQTQPLRQVPSLPETFDPVRDATQALPITVCVVSGGQAGLRAEVLSDENLMADSCLVLEALPGEASCQLVCSNEATVVWRDSSLSSQPVSVAGSPNFWAVSCQDSRLQVYTPAGRRALPGIFLTSPAVYLSTDGAWSLMAVTRDALLHVFDFGNNEKTLEVSLAPIATRCPMNGPVGTPAGTFLGLVSAKFSSTGSPLVTLANGSAFLYHASLQSWFEVAHHGIVGSELESSMAVTSDQALADAELALLRAEVVRRSAAESRKQRVLSASLLRNEGEKTRFLIEDSIACSCALQSESEYIYWMSAYVMHLTRVADRGRLRELCEELNGPPLMPEPSKLPSEDSFKLPWKPVKLGLDRRRFLREFVLPAMAASSELQELANEILTLVNTNSAAGTEEQS